MESKSELNVFAVSNIFQMNSRDKENEIYEFDRFRIEAAMHRLMKKRGNEIIPLSPKNFEFLLLLVRHKGQTLNKEMILDSLWRERFVEENNLTVRVSELRKALGEKRGQNKYIETVTGQGYRFIADVRSGADENSANNSSNKPFESLAVLPFINESGDLNLDYISEGMTESVINNLSQLPQIKVTSRNTVSRFKDDQTDLWKIGEQLDVQAVLIGRIHQGGDYLILSVELIDLDDSSQIWGARIQFQTSDLFETQEIVAKEVAAGLRLRLAENEKGLLSRRYTRSPEVYRLYLKGRYFWNQRNAAINRAIEYFQQAIEIEPNYAPAYAGLADCYISLFIEGTSSPQSAISKAEAAILKGLEIDYSLAEMHVSLANIRFFYNRNWAAAEREYQKGIELNPRYTQGRCWYGNLLTVTERFDEALAQIEIARSLDPLSTTVIKATARILYFARRYDEAVEKCREALEIDSSYALANGVIGSVYIEKGNFDAALREFEKVLQFTAGSYKLPAGEKLETFSEFQKKIFALESDPETIAHVGYTYAVAGKKREALEILAGLKYLYESRYTEPHSIALVCLGLGDKEQALEWLEKAYAQQSVILNFIKIYPLFNSLHSDARFQDLLRRIGFDS